MDGISDLDNLPSVLSQGFEREIRTKNVQVPAILETIQYVNGQPRGIVSKKDDPDMTADDIPLFAAIGGDGYGHEVALHLPEEGVMLCADYPLEESLRESGPVEEFRQRRFLAFQDGMFVPGMKPDDEAGMNSETDEDLWRPHPEPAGTERQVTPEGATHWRVNNEASDIQDGQGPDTPERTHLGLALDGHVPIEGIAELGREGAPRWDPDTLDALGIPVGSELRDVEVDEPTKPIIDPTTEANVNASAATANGPVDFGFFELRNAVLPRFEEDPDPPPDDWPVSVLPEGFAFINVTESSLKIMLGGSVQTIL